MSKKPEPGVQPIVLDDLSVEYPAHGPSPTHSALRGISLAIEPGEILGVLGSAGSGKSTLARMVSGAFADPSFGDGRPVISGGRAEVVGFQLRRINKRQLSNFRLRVGYLPQDGANRLRSDRTIAENVGEPILERDRDFDQSELAVRVATLIDSVHLPFSMLNQFPYELSNGQRQRVALARSLVLGPQLLIADEPTVGIDLSVRDVVAQVIGDLRQQNPDFAALIISHDMPVLQQLVNRVVVLDRGAIVGLGTIDHVFGDPQHPYTAQLAGALDDGHAIIDDLEYSSSN